MENRSASRAASLPMWPWTIPEGQFPQGERPRDELVIGRASMTRFAYLFERFPSFGQTFCYREVAELARQGVTPPIFSIRKPKDEPPQDWDKRIVERVEYLPDEKGLLDEVRRASQKERLPGEVTAALSE